MSTINQGKTKSLSDLVYGRGPATRIMWAKSLRGLDSRSSVPRQMGCGEPEICFWLLYRQSLAAFFWFLPASCYWKKEGTRSGAKTRSGMNTRNRHRYCFHRRSRHGNVIGFEGCPGRDSLCPWECYRLYIAARVRHVDQDVHVQAFNLGTPREAGCAPETLRLSRAPKRRRLDDMARLSTLWHGKKIGRTDGDKFKLAEPCMCAWKYSRTFTL